MLIPSSSLHRRVVLPSSFWPLSHISMVFWRENINVGKAMVCSTALFSITIFLVDIWFGLSRNFLLVITNILLVFFLFCALQLRKNSRLKGRNSWPLVITAFSLFILDHITGAIFDLARLGILIYFWRYLIIDYRKVRTFRNEWKHKKDDFFAREAEFQEYLSKKVSFQPKEKRYYLKNLIYLDHLSISLEKTEFNSQILDEILPYLRPKVQQTAKELIQVYSKAFSIAKNKNRGNLTIALKSPFYLNFDALAIIETDLHNIFSYKSLRPSALKSKIQ